MPLLSSAKRNSAFRIPNSAFHIFPSPSLTPIDKSATIAIR